MYPGVERVISWSAVGVTRITTVVPVLEQSENMHNVVKLCNLVFKMIVIRLYKLPERIPDGICSYEDGQFLEVTSSLINQSISLNLTLYAGCAITIISVVVWSNQK